MDICRSQGSALQVLISLVSLLLGLRDGCAGLDDVSHKDNRKHRTARLTKLESILILSPDNVCIDLLRCHLQHRILPSMRYATDPQRSPCETRPHTRPLAFV